jgi:fluoride ion exporter CrcB/FEX
MSMPTYLRIKCAGQNNFNMKHIKIPIISGLLGVVTTDSDVLFALVHLLLIGSSRLFVDDGLDDPLQAHLKALLGQREDSQL